MGKKEDVAALRQALAAYRGGRFEWGGNTGGSGNMIFFRDREGKLFYQGGMHHPERIVTVLNLILKLLFESSE